jgi:aspartate aminotransferase
MLSRAIFKQGVRSFGVWSGVTSAPPDPILGLNEAFKKETNPKKQLLGMGVYRDNAGKPMILDCVRRAEKKILADDMDHEYGPIDGIATYN